MEKLRHPAKYTDALLPVMASMLTGCRRLLDPMAGTGKIFSLAPYLPGAEIQAVEIEPEWAALHPRTTLGNALALPWPDGYFDAVCVSPSYGNRMADKHVARDASRRNTYTHCLGRKLHPDNSGAMAWGDAYRSFHVAAWTEARRVLRGVFVLNVKDFLKTVPATRADQPYQSVVSASEKKAVVRVHVTQWHVDTLLALGFTVDREEKVTTPGNRQGANGSRRVEYESVIRLETYGNQQEKTSTAAHRRAYCA